MNGIIGVWGVLVTLAIGILYFDKYHHILPEYDQYSSVEYLAMLTALVAILGVLVTAVSVVSAIWHSGKAAMEKDVKEHKAEVQGYIESLVEILDKTNENISFLDRSSRSTMQALVVLFKDYVGRYDILYKTNVLDYFMKFYLAKSIVEFLELIIQHASAEIIHGCLLALAKLRNDQIKNKLDKIEESLFKRCINDSEFKEDAFATLRKPRTNESSNPFKSLIEELKIFMSEV